MNLRPEQLNSLNALRDLHPEGLQAFHDRINQADPAPSALGDFFLLGKETFRNQPIATCNLISTLSFLIHSSRRTDRPLESSLDALSQFLTEKVRWDEKEIESWRDIRLWLGVLVTNPRVNVLTAAFETVRQITPFWSVIDAATLEALEEVARRVTDNSRSVLPGLCLLDPTYTPDSDFLLKYSLTTYDVLGEPLKRHIVDGFILRQARRTAELAEIKSRVILNYPGSFYVDKINNYKYRPYYYYAPKRHLPPYPFIEATGLPVPNVSDPNQSMTLGDCQQLEILLGKLINATPVHQSGVSTRAAAFQLLEQVSLRLIAGDATGFDGSASVPQALGASGFGQACLPNASHEVGHTLINPHRESEVLDETERLFGGFDPTDDY